MKKSIAVLTSLTLLLGACANESKPDDKGATKIESKQEQVKEIFKVVKKDGKSKLELVIDPRSDDFGKYLKNGQFNINGLKIGDEASKIEDKLGKAKEVKKDEFRETFNNLSKKESDKLSEKYNNIKNMKSYYYDEFVINTVDDKISAISLFTLNISEDIRKKVTKENNTSDSEFSKVTEKASEKLYNILAKDTEKNLDDNYIVIKTNDENYLHASILDKKMAPDFTIANKEMSDMIYDIREVISKESNEGEKNIAQEESSSDTEGTISVVNGISHYNIPDILSDDFASSIKDNTFEIDGFGLLKSSDKDPYTSLKPDPKKSADGRAVYDNFQFGLKNGTGGNDSSINNSTPIASITLDVAEQSVLVDDLIEKWNLEKLAFDGGNFKIYNLDSGIHVTLNYDSDSKIINDIVLTEGEFNELAGLENIKDDGVAFTKDEVLTYDFGQKVLSNKLNLGGDINVNSMTFEDTVDDDKIKAAFGEPAESQGGTYTYPNFRIDSQFHTVTEISLDVSNEDISLDELKNTWNKDVETEKESDGMYHTIYDGVKDNGYYVDVISEGGTVTNINIVTDVNGY
ncbi:hypothetical protein [Macrococcus equi]|uniref:hypothetical protein n=1 Tax=Macrococcus equi TaxID=3395462 RepID=UPI0039BE7A02